MTKTLLTILLCGCSQCSRRLVDNGKPRPGVKIFTDNGGDVTAVWCKECWSKVEKDAKTIGGR